MSLWRPCFRRQKVASDEGSRNSGMHNESFSDGTDTEIVTAVSVVELIKRDGSNLGISLGGGADKSSRPQIANLRPGSIAHRCDALSIGDCIISVNGIRTAKLKHSEIANLLKNAGERITLEVEYEIPDSPAESKMCVCAKCVQIRLGKENGSFGFTVRGGFCDERLNSRPLIITQIRPGGPADREGSLKPGDRLLAVDNYNLTNSSHSEALLILKQLSGDSVFTIEYDVALMDSVKNASGPLLVEIEKSPGCQLGMALASSTDSVNVDENPPIVIESIKQASIAERCGALHVGDQILAVDETRVEHMTPAEVTQLLKLCSNDVVKLEILPISQMALRRVPDTSVRKGSTSMASTCMNYPVVSHGDGSNYSTLSSMAAKYSRSKRNKNAQRNNPSTLSDQAYCNTSLSSAGAASSDVASCSQVCRTERTPVNLISDHHRGFGFSIKSGTFASSAPNELVSKPVVASIDPGGPAERCGVMQSGDRLMTINGRQVVNLTIEEVTELIKESRPSVQIELEFDVAESVIPSSGTFTVKLAKRGAGLGITITSPKNRKPGDPLIISDIRKGSITHRTGTIQPGDGLLAIDAVRMDNCTVEDAAQILHSSDDIVKLRIKKDDTYSEDNHQSVVYTVELVRHGGPLGITISGTEEAFDPVLISGLTPNGLAEKTGALHIGDRLLAINGHLLRGKPLSEAIRMLQNSGDVITLKICKHFNKSSEVRRAEIVDSRPDLYKLSTPLPSVDSAVESWDSNGMLDNNSSAPVSRATTSSRPNSGNPDDVTSYADRRHSDIVNSKTDGVGNMKWQKDKWKLGNEKNKKLTSSLSENDKEDWSKILHDLETCGESLALRQLEKTVVATAASDDESVSMSNSSAFETIRRNPNSDVIKQPDVCGSLRYDKWRSKQNEKLLDVGRNYGDLKFSTLPHSGTRLKLLETGAVGPVYPGTQIPVPSAIEIHKVTLFKDGVYEDFGFSVSDGLLKRGVYINRIRPGGPADLCGLLKPFDRILQVNETRTEDFDCCLTVPLIAASGDQIDLIFSRNPTVNLMPMRRMSPPPHDLATTTTWMTDTNRSSSSSPASEVPQTLTKTL